MSEGTNQDSRGPSKKAALVIVSVLLALFFTLTALTTFLGDPTNSLHTSAQSWSFAAIIALAGGYLAIDLMEISNYFRRG